MWGLNRYYEFQCTIDQRVHCLWVIWFEQYMIDQLIFSVSRNFQFQISVWKIIRISAGIWLHFTVVGCNVQYQSIQMKTLIHGDWLYFYIIWKISGWWFYGMTPCPTLKATSLLVLCIPQKEVVPSWSQCCNMINFDHLNFLI